jgi:long-subunit acyl-CoA synthetase (AMP-forming)
VKFFHTGDLGRMVEGKFLKVTGRIKELYKLENGKYVTPVPLEDDICRSQFVLQCMVYGSNRPFNVALIVPDFVQVLSPLLPRTHDDPLSAAAPSLALSVGRVDQEDPRALSPRPLHS